MHVLIGPVSIIIIPAIMIIIVTVAVIIVNTILRVRMFVARASITSRSTVRASVSTAGFLRCDQ